MSRNELPSVSVVIAAYNEEKIISKCLKSVISSDYPKKKLEIILVDDGSTDNTAEITSKFNVRIIKGPHEGVGVARNLGWRKAKNKIIVFIDADQVIKKCMIRKLVKPLENPKIGATDFLVFCKDKDNIYAKLLYLRSILGVYKNKVAFIRGCKKSLLKKFNGFDPKYGYYDDLELAKRMENAGYKVIKLFEAKAYHSEPETLNEVWRQHRWSGKSMVNLTKTHGIRKLRFPLLCVSFPIALVLPFIHPLFLVISIPEIILFLFVEIQRSIDIYKISKWKGSFLTPFFDILTMYMFFTGFLMGLLDSRKPKA